MIRILIEDSYADNNRFHRILDGVSHIARKKRAEIKLYKKESEIEDGCKVVILICQSLKWSVDNVKALNLRNIHPLVFGFQYLDTIYTYSSIAPNFTRSSYLITKYILSRREGKIAVVGFNEDSLPDRLKLKGIEYAAREYGRELQVFENKGDVIKSVEDFAANSEGISNVVCVNDNIAVTIHQSYIQLLEGRSMCSCSGLKISEFFSTPYPVCRIDYYSAGVQLALLYFFLEKEEVTASTVVTFDIGFSLGKTALDISGNAFIEETEAYSRSEIDFFGDKALLSMERLDRMLTDCDEIDIKILKDITENVTYSEIADKYYMNVNTVKYRLKKMLDTVGAASKKELLEIISAYGLSF